MKIKHIRQGENECGPASIAMVTNISLNRAKNLLTNLGWKIDIGLTRREIMTAADQLGFDVQYSDGSFIKDHSKRLKNPAIILVPSKNKKKSLHIIVIYKKKIYDPQDGNKGLKNYCKDSIKSIFKKAVWVIEFSNRE